MARSSTRKPGAPRSTAVSRRPGYNMAPPNEDLPLRGMLKDLCTAPRKPDSMPPWAFATTRYDNWIAPTVLEHALDADPELRAVLARVLDAAGGKIEAGSTVETRALAAILPHIDRVFEEVVLADVLARFDRIRTLVAQYALTKQAIRVVFPTRFPEPKLDDPDDDKESADAN
jgi:hypothetical protein